MDTARGAMIGVVLGWPDPFYHVPVLRGIRHAAREIDVGVATLVTTVPEGAPWFEAEYLASAGFGGVIVLPHTVPPEHDPGWRDFLRRLAPMPLCGVSMDLTGASRVSVDNAAGLNELTRHLAQRHGHRRLAYVRGPEGDADAESRLEALRRAVREYELELDPRCVVVGDYLVRSGRRAVRTLLDERGVTASELDVIVAGNDGMARGVVDELAARGIRVPWQLAVVGFDDGIMAPMAPVPLTTVHQPLHGLGRRALELLVARMQGGESERSVLPTGLVIRRSCGCLEGMGHLELSQEDQRRRGGRGFELALLDRRDATLAEIRRATRDRVAGLAPGWESRLLSTAVDELKGRAGNAFRLAFEDMLDRTLEHRADPAVFHDVVSILWRNLVPCTMADPGLRTGLEGLLDGARLAVAGATQRQQASDLEASEALSELVGDVCVELAATTTQRGVVETVQTRLRALGVRRLAIGIHPRRAVHEVLDRILFLDAGRVSSEVVRMKRSAFASAVLAPGAPSDALILPLHARGAVFGVVGMVVQPLNPFVCLRIRAALSAVLDRLLVDG